MDSLASLLSGRTSPNRAALKPLDVEAEKRRLELEKAQNPFKVPPIPDPLADSTSTAIGKGASQHLQDFSVPKPAANKLGDVFSNIVGLNPAVSAATSLTDAASNDKPESIMSTVQAGLDVLGGPMAKVSKLAESLDNASTPQQLELPLADTLAQATQPKVTGLGHASPHSFDKFEWSPRTYGTGEGAQVYGFGTYFAENPRVLEEHYIPKFSRLKMQYTDPLTGLVNHPGASSDWSVKRAGDALEDARGDFSKARKVLEETRDWYKTRYPETGPDYDETLGVLDQWERGEGGLTMEKNDANLYEVELHADPEQFLDLNAPLSEQRHIWDAIPQEVRDAIDEAMESRGMADMSDALDYYTGKHLYDALKHEEMQDVLPEEIGTSSWLTGDTTPNRHTAAFLQSIGVKGNKFFDAYSRNKSGRGSSRQILLDGKPMSIAASVNTNGQAYAGYILQTKGTPEAAISDLQQERAMATDPENRAMFDEAIESIQSGRVTLAPATRNWVAFSDDIIKIVKKNGVAAALAAGVITAAEAEQLYEEGYT